MHATAVSPPAVSTTPALQPAPQPRTYDQWRQVLADERLPAVVVDLDAFDHNVRQVAQILTQRGHGHRLRLASKSIRVPALMRRVLDFGPPYQGVMCYAADEAAFLASQGFDDLLIAYPTVQPADLQLLRRVHENGTVVRLMLDSVEGLSLVEQAMQGVSRPFPIVLDVDMSLRLWSGRAHLGVRRSPLRSPLEVIQLMLESRRFEHLRVVGVMGYEAQVAGLPDRNPFHRLMNPIAGWIRRTSRRRGAELRRQIADQWQAAGQPLEIFNGGGTGSVNLTVDEPWLTEVTVGSGFVCSHLFDYFSNVHYQPACFFALQVVRSSDPHLVTCQGGGYIASGGPGWDKLPVPYLPAGLKLLPNEGCGEVQTPLEVPVGTHLRLGAPVLFRHAKAGELAERFSNYLLVAGDQIVDRVPTYRGYSQCFF